METTNYTLTEPRSPVFAFALFVILSIIYQVANLLYLFSLSSVTRANITIASLITINLFTQIHLSGNWFNFINENIISTTLYYLQYFLMHILICTVVYWYLNPVWFAFSKTLKMSSVCFLLYGTLAYLYKLRKISNQTESNENFKILNFQNCLLFYILLVFFSLFGVVSLFSFTNFKSKIIDFLKFSYKSSQTKDKPKTNQRQTKDKPTHLVHITYNWTVNNFLLCHFYNQQNKDYIDSEEFGKEDAKFSLRLYPQKENWLDFITRKVYGFERSLELGLYLKFHSFNYRKVNTRFVCCFLSGGNYEQNKKEIIIQMKSDKYYGWAEFCERNSILHGCYLRKNGDLVIKCEIWYDNNSLY